jgi:hypothetical protein
MQSPEGLEDSPFTFYFQSYARKNVSCLLARFRSCALLAASFSKSGENLNFLKYFQVQELSIYSFIFQKNYKNKNKEL